MEKNHSNFSSAKFHSKFFGLLWVFTNALSWLLSLSLMVYLPKLKYPLNVHVNIIAEISGSCHKRQKPQAPTPQAPIRNRKMRKVANAKVLNRNTNLT